jgi:Trypsin
MEKDSERRWRTARRSRTAALGSCALVAGLSCAGAPETPVSTNAPRADVVSPPVGVPDRGDDPAVVAIDVGDAHPCAGALVAADVVLTALHCVALHDAPVACVDAGAGAGPTAWSLRAPGSLRVLVGDDAATAPERARARQIVVPAGAHLCGDDLALVLLDEPIDDVQPLVVRSTGAARGDFVRTVGFGGSGASKAKRLRDHVSVLDTALTELAVAGTALDEGGGPALDEATAEIVGVVSRNGPEPLQTIYTRADAFASLVEGAVAMSESAPSSSAGAKKPKKGPADMGANCTSGVDCAAGVCVSAAGGAQQYCSRGCGAHDRCPSLFACQRAQPPPGGQGGQGGQGEQVCVRR